MKSIDGVGVDDVVSVYSGAPAQLYRLLFGEQLHIGGMKASIDLAERAGIGAGMNGVDLCCGNGAGMRLLVRTRGVGAMVGVDVAAPNVEQGRRRCQDEGLGDRVSFVLGDATASGLADGSADFVWGEDAWCYVADKGKLIAEASRLVRPSGLIVFTDWVEGPSGLSEAEAELFLRMMSFANVEDAPGYERLLSRNGCEVLVAEDTGRFAAHFDLYLSMIEMQLTYDVLASVGHRAELLETVTQGFRFLGELGRAGKIMQARFIAQRGVAS
jgi:SAM-dependent methyltransferase